MINGESKPRVWLKVVESPMWVWVFRAVYVASANTIVSTAMRVNALNTPLITQPTPRPTLSVNNGGINGPSN